MRIQITPRSVKKGRNSNTGRNLKAVMDALDAKYAARGTAEDRETRRKERKKLARLRRHKLLADIRESIRVLRKRAKLADHREHRKQVYLEPRNTGPTVSVDEDALARANCQESFYDFVREFWDVVSQEKPIWNWHIEFLCLVVQEMAERVFAGVKREYDLVVNIPPGTSKSTILSVMLPAWAWTRMPRFKFIGASYSEKLARDDLSLKTRDVVLSDKYRRLFPEIDLREDQNTKGLFQNTHGGWRYAVGVNGSVTGKHAHWITVDDPLDPNEAVSEIELKAANRWIRETLSSRKVDKETTVTALVMQRLHQDDPSAHFLRKKRVRWIKLPAEAEDKPFPPELADRYVGGLLDPVRLGPQAIQDAKENGEQFYATQFSQNPAPPEGAMFKTARLKVGIPPDKWVRKVRFWDKAGTAAGGAWTVGTLMGLDAENRYWVLDVQRFRLDSFDREKVIRKVAERDGHFVEVGVEQEPGSGGKESAEATVRNTLPGFKVRVVKVGKAEGDKQERADPFSVQVNAGNVYLPQWVREGEVDPVWLGWAFDWVEEVKYFPNSRYKDQVDSAALAFQLCARRKVRVGAGW